MRFFALVLIFPVIVFSGVLDGKLIVIDPGHGGPDDRGAVTESGLEEAVINLKVALYLREMLEKEGAVVVMTRTTDRSVSLRERVEIANRLNADLFLCLHHNYMETNRNADFSIVYFPSRSMDYSINLAHALAEEFEKYVGTKPGDIGPGDVYVMRNLKVPGILGEPCLMSNWKREEWLRKDENLKREAEAYFRAVLKLFSLEIPELRFEDTVISQEFSVESNSSLEKAWVYLSNKQLDYEIYGKSIKVVVPDTVKPGEYELVIFVRSEDGVYSKGLRKFVIYKPIPDSLEIFVYPKIAPEMVGSYFRIDYSFKYGSLKLESAPKVRINHGFYQIEGSSIFVPFSGATDVTLELSFGGVSRSLNLRFGGKEKVRVLFLKDESGNTLDVIEYRGGKLEIEKRGYEKVVYEASLEEPVSFDTVVLKKTVEGVFMGKTVGIAYHPEYADLVKSISERLESFGAGVLTFEIKNMRDEFKAARTLNKRVSVVVLLGPEGWDTKLKKLLKVPYVEERDISKILETLSEILK